MGVKLNTHLYLVQRLRMSGVIHLLPPTCLRGLDRDNFACLGAFAKLRKATISFVMSVRPTAWNSSAPKERIFMKFDICEFFRKSVQKIQVSFKCDKNNEYFT